MVSNAAKHVLFFEVAHEGHVASHTDALVAAAATSDPTTQHTFAVSEHLLERLLPDTRKTLDQDDRVNLRILTDAEVKACRTGNGFKQGPARWQKAVEIATDVKADHIFFYQMDSALYGAFISRHYARIPFSGILFHPEMHLCLKRPPKSLKRFIDQALFYSLTLPLKNLKRVWSLDPIFPEFSKRWLPAGNKVVFLPEIKIPLPTSPLPEGARDGKTTFLLYGILKRRKGVINLLDALALVPEELHGRIRIVLAGAVADDISSALSEKINHLRDTCPDLEIVSRFQFLDEPELAELIMECDVVLAPYIGHKGSSGVVYTAARAGKPIISTNEALLGELVERYELGSTINPRSAEDLARALEDMLGRTRRASFLESSKQQEYLDLNSPNFAVMLLSETVGGRVFQFRNKVV